MFTREIPSVTKLSSGAEDLVTLKLMKAKRLQLASGLKYQVEQQAQREDYTIDH